MGYDSRFFIFYFINHFIRIIRNIDHIDSFDDIIFVRIAGMYILGISAFYHDSAACLIKDGVIIAAVQEERFSRKKHDSSFPDQAIEYCLRKEGLSREGIDYIVFYDKPFLKFERLLRTYLAYAPKGVISFMKAMSIWGQKKLWIKELIKKDFGVMGDRCQVLFSEHHESHGASAFFPSPFEESAFLTIDGVGEWATTSYGVGNGNGLQILADISFPHSIGLLYSAFTYYTGFRVNSGEYKLMGLAPYGESKYKSVILDHLIDLKEDGSFRLNMDYFDYCVGSKMTNAKFHDLFGGLPRAKESEITQRHMDLARSIQEVIEEIILKIVRHIRKELDQEYLCLAGGVALNCVVNGRILKEKIFKDIWIQPASGDSGGALGAALLCWYQYLENPRYVEAKKDSMRGGYLGPSYSHREVLSFLRRKKVSFEELSRGEICDRVAGLICEQKVIGWFQGAMEFGPRALGARSIIGDARSSKMQEIMNLKIKFRENFRPFAPSILWDRARDYFDIDGYSPYMLLTFDILECRRKELSREERLLLGLDKLRVVRSDIPAVTHVDYSARIQTVHEEAHWIYYELIREFEKRTGYPIIINTSFNVRGEPIVCSPGDAYDCFMKTGLDYLMMEGCLLRKEG